jgi:nucleoside-diphosphate-sugar epimerase
MPKRVFITGASGCVGHYLVELLIQQTDYELYLLVRDRAKLKLDLTTRSGIHVIEGAMEDIAVHQQLLSTMNYVVSTAAAWGGTEETLTVNLHKTLELFNYLDPSTCDRAIYFSTASILDQHNQILPEAETIGTDYIRSKYACLEKLENSRISDRLITVFPTLVFGGDHNKPYSHLSGGLKQVAGYINLIKWFKGDGSFHFIHASDIAQIIVYLLDADLPSLMWHVNDFDFPARLVLGTKQLTVDQAISEACEVLGKKVWWQISLNPWLIDVIIKIFKIQVAAWDQFCIQQRHFTYDVVSPETFGLKSKYPRLANLLA